MSVILEIIKSLKHKKAYNISFHQLCEVRRDHFDSLLCPSTAQRPWKSARQFLYGAQKLVIELE